jgi:NMD protein affecting ribosome stability and mRNA decay
MLKAPKGPAICRKCKAIYANKRWCFDEAAARKLAASPRTQKLVCPACQKIRDDYPEGLVTLKWSGLRDHEAEIRG